nr:LysR substrate-binding domain-containing protein [Pigmentiphaga litoralis]
MDHTWSLAVELRQLRYFSVLAEELNFTRAAARLHISQPPLSMQIAQLETELGAALFRRTSRRVELTEAGVCFLHDVRAVLARLKDAGVRVRAVDQGLAGRVEVGLSGSHFLGPLPDLIARYATTHPDVSVILNEMKPSDQIDALREHRIDVSFTRACITDPLLDCVPLWPDPVLAVLPAGHPLAAKRQLRLAELADEHFVVLRRDTSAFAQHIFDCCAKAGFTPRASQAVSEVPAQLNLVEAGLGVALVPASTCQRLKAGVVTCTLTDPTPQANVFAIVRKDSPTKARETFLASIAAPLEA